MSDHIHKTISTSDILRTQENENIDDDDYTPSDSEMAAIFREIITTENGGERKLWLKDEHVDEENASQLELISIFKTILTSGMNQISRSEWSPKL